MCFIIGVIFAILGTIFLNPIVRSLGVSDHIYPYARDYSRYLIYGAAIIMCNFALGQLLRSEGSTMISMIGMLIGTVANTILDPIFIFVLHMGITGAAIATVIGNGLSLAFYCSFYFRGKSMIKFRIKNISLEKDIWKEIFSIGIPSSVSQFLMGAAVMICNNLIINYGNNTVAGMGIATKVMTIGTYIFMGFAVGCQPLIGYNYGAKNFPRVNEVIKKGMIITSGLGIILTLVLFFFSKGFISFFTPLTEVMEKGNLILRGLMWSLPVFGAQMVGAVSIQAMGKSKASFFVSILRQGLLYIPLVLMLNLVFGLYGLIYAQPIADFFALVFTGGIIYYLNGKGEQTQIQSTGEDYEDN